MKLCESNSTFFEYGKIFAERKMKAIRCYKTAFGFIIG